MKYLPLRQLNGVFGVIKPYGFTAAKTCNRIRFDLVKGTEALLVEILQFLCIIFMIFCHCVTSVPVYNTICHLI